MKEKETWICIKEYQNIPVDWLVYIVSIHNDWVTFGVDTYKNEQGGNDGYVDGCMRKIFVKHFKKYSNDPVWMEL